MQRDFLQRNAKQRGQPSGVAGAGWQALDGDPGHGVVSLRDDGGSSIA